MSDVLLLLRLEHKNMGQLLMLMDNELAQLQKGETPDYDVLELTVHYFSQFPDMCHHPKEDLIFRRLERQVPEISATQINLAEEHQELSRLTQGLASVVRETREKPSGSMERLCGVLSDFLTRYRHHMALEEQQFFPMASDLLSESDWAAIKFDLFDREDPVFDLPVEGKFKKLREKIDWLAQRHSELKRQQALLVLSKEEAEWLRHKGTMASFNRALEHVERGIRLVRIAGAGYALKQGASLIIDIPECSEGRAVWCAYYFLKGREASDAGAE